MKKVTGGVCVPKGFKAAGAHVGLKRKRKDLAILASDVPATVCGVFTTNVVKGAPVIWSQTVANSGKSVRAVVVNSGHANSCTGPDGFVHCTEMAETTASELGVRADEVIVASTGYIGVPVPIDTVKAGIPVVASMLAGDEASGTACAEAIKTTDSFTKEIAFEFEIGGVKVHIGAMAKGSGMVHPNMATMLAFITTDVDISREALCQAMRGSVEATYNMISVDGDTSTNDMAIVIANGLAGNTRIECAEGDDFEVFKNALHTVNELLAKQIAKDGEGATKFVEVEIVGGESNDDARKIAKSVVSSSLVKTALFGQDANWGRIIAAMGRGGVVFDPQRVSIQFESEAGELSLMKAGQPVAIDSLEATRVLSEKDIRISIDLMNGSSSARAWGCDLTYDYVRINGAYRA